MGDWILYLNARTLESGFYQDHVLYWRLSDSLGGNVLQAPNRWYLFNGTFRMHTTSSWKCICKIKKIDFQCD
jgi:hypothetical protein